MKNLFSNFNFSRTPEGGNFLFQGGGDIITPIKPKEIKPSDLEVKKNLEIEKREIVKVKTGTEKDLLKTDMAVSAAKEQIGKTPVTEEYLKQTAKEILEKDPKFREIEGKRTEYELFLALNNYQEEADLHSYADHWHEAMKDKFIPSDVKNNLKAGGFVGLIAFMHKEAGWAEKAGVALKWGLIVAGATHPLITSSIAHGAEFLGKEVLVPGSTMTINFIGNMIDDPKEVLRALSKGMDGGSDFSKTPIGILLKENKISERKVGEALTISQSPKYLLDNGMKFSPRLETLINFMAGYKKGGEIDGASISTAAEFMVRSENFALPDEYLKKVSKEFWNSEKETSASKARKVVAGRLRKEITEFIRENNELNIMFQTYSEEAKGRLVLPDGDTQKLQKLSLVTLKDEIGIGQDFSKLYKELPRGITGLMKDPGGGLVKFMILIWGLLGITMTGRKLFQAETYKKVFSKENVKKRVGQIAKVPFLPLTGLWLGAKWMTKNSDSARAIRTVAQFGNSGEVGNKKWSDKQKDAWEKLPKNEKKIVAKKLGAKIEETEKELRETIVKLKKKHGETKWWKFLKNRKTKKKYETVPEYVTAREKLKNVTLDISEWEALFPASFPKE